LMRLTTAVDDNPVREHTDHMIVILRGGL
jgi:hypothetical protein